jgi:hypothetical protein
MTNEERRLREILDSVQSARIKLLKERLRIAEQRELHMLHAANNIGQKLMHAEENIERVRGYLNSISDDNAAWSIDWLITDVLAMLNR